MSPFLAAEDTKIVEGVLSPDGSKIAVVTVDDIDRHDFIYETSIRDYSPQTQTWEVKGTEPCRGFKREG